MVGGCGDSNVVIGWKRMLLSCTPAVMCWYATNGTPIIHMPLSSSPTSSHVMKVVKVFRVPSVVTAHGGCRPNYFFMPLSVSILHMTSGSKGFPTAKRDPSGETANAQTLYFFRVC